MNANGHNSADWFEDEEQEADDIQIEEYDLTSTPNDFNIVTLYNFIESGTVEIPDFQRNYVWDLKRASKLIESLIMGLPVPQVFLYEEQRNKFLVIDGQQRLMSVYYFMKGRFPKKEKRNELRLKFEQDKKFGEELLKDNSYFEDFTLSIPSKTDQKTKFHGWKYETLGEYRSQFDLRPLRTIVVKQNAPKEKDGDSSVYEIFNRLNTGGVNLEPQEIRASLYPSDFYKMLDKINTRPIWRNLVRMQEPDLHRKDVEILLRGFAILIDGNEYKPSLVKFLNNFSKRAKRFSKEKNEYLEKLFDSFLNACKGSPDLFFNEGNKRFTIALFESVFVAVCEDAYGKETLVQEPVSPEWVRNLAADQRFKDAATKSSSDKKNLETRLRLAREHKKGLAVVNG